MTAKDGSNMREMIAIIRTCADGVMSDNALTLADLLKVGYIIIAIINSVNRSNGIRDSTVTQRSKDLSGIVEAIVMSFLQIVIKSDQYDIIINLVDAQFQLLQLTTLPVIASKVGCPWF
jgi:hypothetical protein